MQIGQRLRVIHPGAFGHKPFDQLEHPIGAVDESVQHFAGVGVLGPIAALIQKPFGARSVLGRRQTEECEEITRLIVSSRLLELGFPLGIDQGGRHIRKRACRISECSMALSFHKNGPAGTETTQGAVEAACDGDEFGRDCAVEIRSAEPCGALERTVLVEDDALPNQCGPRQEIREAGI